MSSEIERLKREAARDPSALIRLADTLVAAGRGDEAVSECRRGLQGRPTDVPLKLALGRALMAVGNLAEAQKVLAEAAATPPATGASLATEGEPEATREWQPAFSEERTDANEDEFDGVPTTARRREDVMREVAPQGQRRDQAQSFRVGEPQRRAPEPAPEPPRRSAPEPRAPEPDEPRRPSFELPPNAAHFDLARVADQLASQLHTGDDADPQWDSQAVVPPDPAQAAWEAKRARAFFWLWGGLGIVTAGIVAGSLWRAHERAKVLAAIVAKADARMVESTFEGDWAARDGYASAVRIDPKDRRYFAMVALASARLAADQGEDTDAGAWAMLRRSEREAARHKLEPDARADRELRQARGLLALARGEACPPLKDDEDGDIAARCASQRGDIDAARRILDATLKAGDPSRNLRALLALGSLELGAGDLDAADAAFRRVLEVSSQHPRALVGRALVAIERGEASDPKAPEGVKLGATTEAWFHLARGLSALDRGGPDDEALAKKELDQARKGIVHDGRLALLYGRARLLEGQVSEAEQAMRVAERLDPNDGDVAVLDAEVALAKGFEDKVVDALSVGAATPRKLAVLGRAQVLVGKYREAAATLDAALARRPGDATAVTYRAIAKAHLGDQAGALRDLEKAAATLKSTTPRYGLGLLAYERHDLLKARTELQKALDHNSESFRARALLGRVLRDLGKPKEALTELEHAAKDAPALASVHEALGRLYLDLGRYREARSELRKVLDVPGKPTADDRLVYAEATLELGLTDDGLKALGEAGDAGALQARVDHLKSIAQSWKSGKDAAEAAKALEKERKGAGAHDARLAIDAGNAWRRAGDPRKAGDDLRAALYGDALHANLGLGRIELAGADPANAEASFKAALKAWSTGPYGVDDQTEARIGLARALLARKASGEAITTLQPCLTDDPTAPEPRYWLAKAYLDQAQPNEARPHAEKATELDDHYAEAFLLVGELNRAVDKNKAKQAYRKYLELQPNGPDAKNVKKILAALK